MLPPGFSKKETLAVIDQIFDHIEAQENELLLQRKAIVNILYENAKAKYNLFNKEQELKKLSQYNDEINKLNISSMLKKDKKDE
jgi:hypothetical protein